MPTRGFPLNEEKTVLSDTLYQFGATPETDIEEETPLRSELFSAAQMAMHGKFLAYRKW
jgi:hypothetical protein